MTDSTDDVDMGYDGSDIPEDPRQAKINNNIKNIDKFIKPLGKNKKGKVPKEPPPPPIDFNGSIKELHYLFKVSKPISDKKFSSWYTIEYSETRGVIPGVDINTQRAELENAVEDEVYNAISILQERVED